MSSQRPHTVYPDIIDVTADTPSPKTDGRYYKPNQGPNGRSAAINEDDFLYHPHASPLRSSHHSNYRTSYYSDSQSSSQRSQPSSQQSSQASRPDFEDRSFGSTIAKPKPKAGQHTPGKFFSSHHAVSAFDDKAFGSSVLKAKPKPPSAMSRPASTPTKNVTKTTGSGYNSYIKPGTGAFGRYQTEARGSPFEPAGYKNGWPAWVEKPDVIVSGASTPPSEELQARKIEGEVEGEEFDIADVQYTAQDFEKSHGDPEEQMRELLSGAVGEGEDGDAKEGDDIVEGFAEGMRLMPHQVRGVKWMRERESGRKRGGILADDMGLGKTVQSLACIVKGPPTAAEKKAYKGGTLIVCPLAVMAQWATEIKTKTGKGVLSVTTHQGPKRTKSGKELEKYDVVITTFQVLSNELNTAAKEKASRSGVGSDDSDDAAALKKKTKKKASGQSALASVNWLRVIIDEAQNIKNHKTQTAKAAVALTAKYRWCLTGTPIQNNVEELYSLFKFLRAKPLDDWQIFRSRVSSEVKEGRTGVAMKRLHVILKAIMLRRTKNATIDGKPILNLPARIVTVERCEFDADERSFYDALEQQTSLTLSKYVKAGTASANYTNMLTLLLRLRQACDHPSLVTKSLNVDKDALANDIAQPNADVQDADQADDLADALAGLGLSKRKCDICLTVLEDQTRRQCPPCAELAYEAEVKSVVIGKPPPSSAKIRKTLDLLRGVAKRSGNVEKTIIFSQFTSFLDLLEPFVKQEKFNYVRYDGTLSADERAVVLDDIRTKPEVKVILISFKAGSTGLNLTCCNNVILTDMWWNPALEDQAFDRAHRLGQMRDVNIWKLAIDQTVEDRILALQTSKRELADAALSGTTVKNMNLTMADIMQLFRRSHNGEE